MVRLVAVLALLFAATAGTDLAVAGERGHAPRAARFKAWIAATLPGAPHFCFQK